MASTPLTYIAPTAPDASVWLCKLLLRIRADTGEYYLENGGSASCLADGMYVYCGSDPKFWFGVRLGPIWLSCPHWRPPFNHVGCRRLIQVRPDEAQAALGLLLASLGVQLHPEQQAEQVQHADEVQHSEQVQQEELVEQCRAGGNGFKLAVDRRVQVKEGTLDFIFIRTPTNHIPGFRDWDAAMLSALFWETLRGKVCSDVLAVAAALGACPVIKFLVEDRPEYQWGVFNACLHQWLPRP